MHKGGPKAPRTRRDSRASEIRPATAAAAAAVASTDVKTTTEPEAGVQAETERTFQMQGDMVQRTKIPNDDAEEALGRGGPLRIRKIY